MSWTDIEQGGTTYTVRSFRTYNPKKTDLTYAQWCAREERRRLRRLKKLRRRNIKPTIPRKQKGHKEKFARPDYHTYIASFEWKERRDSYLNRVGRRCQACGAKNSITVHHTHYGFLGREKDQHLAGLCWSCHGAFHDKYGTHTVMQKETAEFIANVKMGVYGPPFY